jgi:hypothetical protein
MHNAMTSEMFCLSSARADVAVGKKRQRQGVKQHHPIQDRGFLRTKIVVPGGHEAEQNVTTVGRSAPKMVLSLTVVLVHLRFSNQVHVLGRSCELALEFALR